MSGIQMDISLFSKLGRPIISLNFSYFWKSCKIEASDLSISFRKHQKIYFNPCLIYFKNNIKAGIQIYFTLFSNRDWPIRSLYFSIFSKRATLFQNHSLLIGQSCFENSEKSIWIHAEVSYVRKFCYYIWIPYSIL